MTIRQPVRRHCERGSALLIVFVFAAIIAIMLYRELPIVAFEARRTKEQTLVDRGHEYSRAVQLYYRKFHGRYPANIDMLENSNNMRFLRRRYVDPFTGKDDWRLLHAGPGGQLMDSKVQNFNQNGVFGQSGTNTNTNSSTLGTGFGGSANSNSSTAPHGFEDSSSSSDSDVTVAPVVKRAPMVAANSQGGSPTSNELNQDPSIPLLPSQDPNGGSASALVANPPGTTPGADDGSPNQQVKPSANGASQAPGQAGNGAANGGGSAATSGFGGNVLGGAFAGVASKAKGHTIKKVNEQTDYSLWEFWYDPTKDTSMGMAGNLQNGAGGQTFNSGAPGANAPPAQAPSTQSPVTNSPDTSGTVNPPVNPPAQPQ